MGPRVSHMNIAAISSITQTTEVDIRNLLLRFEGRPLVYPFYVHNRGEKWEFVPISDNPPEPEFILLNSGKRVYITNGEEPEDIERKVSLAEAKEEEDGFKPGSVQAIQAAVRRAEIEAEQAVIDSKKNEEDELQRSELIAKNNEAKALQEEELRKFAVSFSLKKLEGEKNDDEGIVNALPEFIPPSYLISLDAFMKLLNTQHISDPDKDMLAAIFCLVDKRGFSEADLRFILVSFCLIVAKDSMRQCLELIFCVVDRGDTNLLEKTDLLRLVVLINETIVYFGDRHLEASQTVDLVDSIYTAAGKVDGAINYVDYFDVILQHPIVEMFVSPQFQGLTRDKTFDGLYSINYNIIIL